MSDKLRASLLDINKKATDLLHDVASSEFEYGHEEEQLSFEIEARLFELGEALDLANRLGNQ